MEKFSIDQDDLEFAFNPTAPRRRLTKEQHLYGIWAEEMEEIDNSYGSISGRRKFAAKAYAEPIGFVSGGITKPTIKDEISDEDEEFERKPIKDDDYEDQEIEKPFFEKSRFSSNINLQVDSKIGEWERHTKGIGQKLLLQMGYQSGKGLGKHGQGRTLPVEAIKRKGKGAIGAYGPEQVKKNENVSLLLGSESKKSTWKKNQEIKVNSAKSNKTNKGKLNDVDETKPFWAPEFLTGHYNTESDKTKVIDLTGKEAKITTGYDSISRHLTKPDLFDSTENQNIDKKYFDMPELRHNLDILLRSTEKALKTNRKRLTYETKEKQLLADKRKKLEASIGDMDGEILRLNKLSGFIDKFINPHEDILKSLDDCKNLLDMFRVEFNTELKIYDFKNLITSIIFPMLKNVLENWDPFNEPNFILDKLLEWRQLLQELENDIGIHNVKRNSYENGEPEENITFQKMLWYIWMPKVRKSIQDSWDPRDSDLLIDFIKIWEFVIPYWIRHNMLDQLIIPKLLSELSLWDPTTDTVPIHTWIHPWLPYIETATVETAFSPIIREKLSNALRLWEPSDRSAKLIISPWHTIFKAKDFDLFLIKCIMPKLNDLAYNLLKKANNVTTFPSGAAPGRNPYIIKEDGSAVDLQLGNVIESSLINGFKTNVEEENTTESTAAINITDWYVNEWLWILEWESLISPTHLIILLQNTFFPIMKSLLKRALSEILLPLHLKTLGSNIDFMTISEWYMNWKNLFPSKLVESSEIKAEFDSLLHIINTHLISLENASFNPPPGIFYPSGPSLGHQEQSEMHNNLLNSNMYAYNYIPRGVDETPPISILTSPPPPPPPPPPPSFPPPPSVTLTSEPSEMHYFQVHQASAAAAVKASFDYAAYAAATNELTFKEFVQNRLESFGIIFGPSKVTNIYHLNLPANKQLYKVIGSNNRPHQVYIDKGVLFVYHQSFNQTSNNNNVHNSTQFHWKPISVNDLIKLVNH